MNLDENKRFGREWAFYFVRNDRVLSLFGPTKHSICFVCDYHTADNIVNGGRAHSSNTTKTLLPVPEIWQLTAEKHACIATVNISLIQLFSSWSHQHCVSVRQHSTYSGDTCVQLRAFNTALKRGIRLHTGETFNPEAWSKMRWENKQDPLHLQTAHQE